MTRTSNRTKARKARDNRSAIERTLDERREAHRTAWAHRHPAAAARERTIRRSNARLQDRWRHKNEGTAETHEHASHQEGALARLYRTGTIDAEQLASAVEIALIADRIAADVTVKTASLETRVDANRSADVGFHEKLSQVRREYAYTEWRAGLKQPAVVLDMLVGDPVGFTIVAKRYRMHNRRAKRLLIEALDQWPPIVAHACRQIDHERLQRAHAQLLA